jgi:hypothetical protein
MGFQVSAKERTREFSGFKQRKELAGFPVSTKEGTSGLSYSNLQVSPR